MGKTTNKQQWNNHQHSTPDTRQPGLAGENNHSNINNSKKSISTTLDLNITRRPLSPVHNLEPKKIIIKRKAAQPIPVISTTNKSASSENNVTPNTKGSLIQIKSIKLNTVQPVSATDSENFENIIEEQLPTLGDDSVNNMMQPKTKIAERQSASTRD